MREADAVGIDAPFGWPRFLIDHLPAYARESSFLSTPGKRRLREPPLAETPAFAGLPVSGCGHPEVALVAHFADGGRWSDSTKIGFAG